MRGAFYPKLALDGIRKNKRLYIPYILTCVGMVTMFYIITFLQKSETVGAMRSGSAVQRILSFGIIVIAVFACIFLFYTNSFLMKRRKKEFGLYNILGMGKRNIGIILVWESLIIALFSLAVGLFIGIAISKLAELALVNILRGAVKYSFSISPCDSYDCCRVRSDFSAVASQFNQANQIFKYGGTSAKRKSR